MSDFNPQLDTGNVERYTPPHIIKAARRAMGWISLDPASNAVANATVRAHEYFTIDDDGLSKPWWGNVWLNHPYSRGERACKPNCRKKKCNRRGYCATADVPANADWINKLIREYDSARVTQACCITWLSGSSNWFQELLSACTSICILKDRPRFIRGETMLPLPSAMKDACVFYFGPYDSFFAKAFGSLGIVLARSTALPEHDSEGI